jgi:hypothetical protein
MSLSNRTTADIMKSRMAAASTGELEWKITRQTDHMSMAAPRRMWRVCRKDYVLMKKPKKRSSNRLSQADMQALTMLDRILETDRQLEQKYSLPFRAPHQVATSLQPCAHCRRDIALLIFGDYATDAAGLEVYARLTADLIQQTNLPAYVISPPSDPSSLDNPALLLKVYPIQEEPGFITPTGWEQLIGRLSDEHCKR